MSASFTCWRQEPVQSQYSGKQQHFNLWWCPPPAWPPRQGEVPAAAAPHPAAGLSIGTRQAEKGWALKPRETAVTGFSKKSRKQIQTPPFGGFPELWLAGCLPLPENSRSTKTSPEIQHFL